jgi:hypothetical protein
MRRLGIVAPGLDPSAAQELLQLRPRLRPRDEEVPDGDASAGYGRETQVADAVELGEIGGGGVLPARVPAVEQRELRREHHSLERVEPRGEAFEVVPVLRALSVLPERAHILGQLGVVRHERAGIAHGTEVLRRVEAERRRPSSRARPDAVPPGAVRLACVLDDREAARRGERIEGDDVRHLSVEMHRHDRPRPPRNRGLRRSHVDVVVLLRDVDHDGARAGL